MTEGNGRRPRYNGTYDRECLKKQRPTDQAQAQAVSERFAYHHNFERPHQGPASGNRPPRTAFPDLPALPGLPAFVDPDAWLQQAAGRPYVRRINQNGTIKIDHCPYYIKRALAGHHVLARVDAHTGEFVVEHRGQPLKRVPIQGLQRRIIGFEAYVDLMLAEALSEWRRYLANHAMVRSWAAC